MKIRAIIPIALIAIFSLSCSNELNLVAEWKDIPIVYGKISISDPVHYLRIEKAFLDPETDALEIAKISDSIYYDNLTVEIERLSDNQVFQLERVDGNQEGYIRDDGIFATEPNYLYKIRANQMPLEGGESIRLMLNRGDNLPIVTATTTVLPQMEYLSNRPPGLINKWNKETPVRVQVKPNSDDTQIFDLTIVFKYDERTAENPNEIVQQEVVWLAEKNRARIDEEKVTLEFSVNSDEFFQYIGDNIEKSASTLRRFLELEFITSGGGQEIKDFVSLTLSNSGVTSSQDPPVYTNLSEGFGIFTSTGTAKVTGILFGSTARDSLINGRFTKDLNFQ